MAIDLNQVFARLTPGSTWRLSQSTPPHTLIEWRGPDPQPTPTEIENAWITIEAEQAAAETAKQEADLNYEAALTAWTSAPDWLRTFSDEDIENYVAVNVTNLESAKTALIHLGKAVRIIVKALKLNYLTEQS